MDFDSWNLSTREIELNYLINNNTVYDEQIFENSRFKKEWNHMNKEFSLNMFDKFNYIIDIDSRHNWIIQEYENCIEEIVINTTKASLYKYLTKIHDHTSDSQELYSKYNSNVRVNNSQEKSITRL